MAYMDLFIEHVNGLPDYLIYFFLGLSAFLENLIPPMPGDMVTAFGAFMVGTGRLGFSGVYTTTTLGSLLGFMSLFWIGERLGRRFFIVRDYRFFKKEDIRKAEQWFRKYGYLIVSLNRFLPGIRSVISITSGISGLRTPLVALLALISCALWNLVWIALGYSLGNNWKVVESEISSIFARYNLIIFSIFILLLLIFIIRKISSR
jgi:membrane protein DedA with SNARE-associated domain